MLEYTEFDSSKIGSRKTGTVDVTGITELTFVEVILVAVEHVLHATVDLYRVAATDFDVISQFYGTVEEGLGFLQHVFLDESSTTVGPKAQHMKE